MFTIIQSHRTERLVEQLLLAYQSKDQSVFEEFVVIVPSMVLGDWLDKSIASQAGISTLVTTKFWGQYQWTLMQKVLADYNDWLENTASTQEIITVPEVAVLTGAVMQWRLFGYFTYYQSNIMSDDTHPLYPLLSALLDEDSDRSQQDIRLWSLATDFSRVFSRYLTHREEWLSLWSNNKVIDVATMIAQKDELSIAFDENAGTTPEWLIAHYIELEAAQRHLWHLLFASVYEHRASIETRFWDIMTDKDSNEKIDMQAILPRQLHIFTIQQLPQNELDFLQRLSSHINITLLHYNPSQLFWADIVDKQWLQRQQVINPKSVFLRDYGHTLLSRLGKQSRETFAMLANLDSSASAKGFQLDWQDRFEDDVRLESSEITTNSEPPLSLLAHLQQDVLMLDESATQQTTAGRVSAALGAQIHLDTEEGRLKESDLEKYYSDDALKIKHNTQPNRQWLVSQYDNSLSIHSCHNLQRQLEVLRGMIGRWLNDANEDDSRRHLSDIVVLLPDVERHHDLISSIFVNGKGQDGLSLPAKVTGVVDKSIRQLWEAISGFYSLLGSDTARFEAAEVLDWLMLPPLYESLGLTHEQMSQGCELLTQAGFVRGFDEAHLQQTLDVQDYDYRFSFAYALDQLALGLIMPEAGISDCLYPDHWQAGTLAEKTVPMSTIALGDATIIEALCRVHTGLYTCRYQYKDRHNAEDWLNRIESHIIHPFFGALDQTRPMRAIFNAMNGFKSSLRANRHYQRYHANNKAENVGSHIMVNSDADVLTANQVEARLSKVNTLPLKLSFMLDSIEDELESQQVSAEPTGVITFGRFGALRNVPFGLVVMLNMDLSEFPNRDRDNRYDLMKAGLAKRGDRFSEDDDNGAFLDALLCARSACWIFYNGQRLTDTHEHLPANPVSELLQFLRGEVQWQWPPLESEQYKLRQLKHDDTVSQIESSAALVEQIQRYLPKLIDQWLITRHPALPFAEEVFIKPDVVPAFDEQDEGQAMVNLLTRAMQAEKQNQRSTNAPARVWQDVFERLQQKDKMRQTMKVTLPNKAKYQHIAHCIDSAQQSEPFDTVHVDMQRLYMQVRHPIKHFLKEQQVHIVLPTEDTVYQEPLSLTGLSTYTVNSQLLSNMHIDSNTKQSLQGLLPLDRLLYDPVMPAGVLRQSTLQYQRTKIEEQCREFADQLAQLNINVQALSADNRDTVEANHSLSLLTACAEKMVTVTATGMNAQNQLQIKGIVPIHVSIDVPIDALVDPSINIATDIPIDKTAPELWLNILPNSARTQYLLRFWLAHVFWQVSRQTTQAQVIANHGRSIWRFNKAGTEKTKHAGATTFSLAPIVYEAALNELLKWIRFAHIAGTTPMTVLPVYAMTYLQKLHDVNNKGGEYLPKRSDFTDWLWVQYGNDVVYDTCSQHELWQYVLDKQDTFVALADALPILAKPLFGMMNEALTAL